MQSVIISIIIIIIIIIKSSRFPLYWTNMMVALTQMASVFSSNSRWTYFSKCWAFPLNIFYFTVRNVSTKHTKQFLYLNTAINTLLFSKLSSLPGLKLFCSGVLTRLFLKVKITIMLTTTKAFEELGLGSQKPHEAKLTKDTGCGLGGVAYWVFV